MKPALFILLLFTIFSCAPKAGYITISQKELDNPTHDSLPYPKLYAYHKRPGAPKDVYVQRYYKPTQDSCYVEAHYRSKPGSVGP